MCVFLLGRPSQAEYFEAVEALDARRESLAPREPLETNENSRSAAVDSHAAAANCFSDRSGPWTEVVAPSMEGLDRSRECWTRLTSCPVLAVLRRLLASPRGTRRPDLFGLARDDILAAGRSLLDVRAGGYRGTWTWGGWTGRNWAAEREDAKVAAKEREKGTRCDRRPKARLRGA